MIRYLTACGLTVLIETGFFLLLGWRDRDRITVVICANIATNLLLNLTLDRLIPRSVLSIAVGEGLVVIAEYAIYARLNGRSRILALQTLLANALSFGTGVLLYWI